MDFERFKAYAVSAGTVPVWRELLLDTETPVTAFAKLRRGPFSFLLESAPAGSETWSRYTFMGSEPASAWRISEGVAELWTPENDWHGAHETADPLAELESLVREARPATVPELGVFWGGAVGFLGYDMVRAIERLESPPPKLNAVPDALFLLTRGMVVMDNLRGRARIVVSVRVPRDATERTLRTLYRAAHDEIDATAARFTSRTPLTPLSIGAVVAPVAGHSTYTRAAFIDHVERIKEYIRAGDCFQTLLARRIEVAHDFSGDDLYRAIRAINPSPYMYHLELDGTELVGSSPELLVRVSDGDVTVRPIAGTRRRGTTPEADAALAAELLADEKERAEHVMLVDLGRNDVGRVAEYGSVGVGDFMTVEKYSHVLHIVSEVTGRLRHDTGTAEVLRAVFPAGTMTGAPKVRAMQIIDELEPERRGPYAGAVGYLGWGGARVDLAITIRTCVIADGVASVQAGAGIVADSVPETEWEETETKARAMLTAIAQVRREGPRAEAVA